MTKHCGNCSHSDVCHLAAGGGCCKQWSSKAATACCANCGDFLTCHPVHHLATLSPQETADSVSGACDEWYPKMVSA
jgi:hypothetical protein